MILRYLIEKEFKQLKRNKFLPRLILIFFPCMMMFGHAVGRHAGNRKTSASRSSTMIKGPSSQRLVHQIEASRYFKLTGINRPNTIKVSPPLKKTQADVLLEIPQGFEKEQVNGRPASTLIAVNAVNGSKGSLGSAYLTQILSHKALPPFATNSILI